MLSLFLRPCSYAAGVGTKDGMFDKATLASLRSHADPHVASHPFLSFFEGASVPLLFWSCSSRS